MVEPVVGTEDMDAWLANLEQGGETYDLSRILPPINAAVEGEHVGERPDDEPDDDEPGNVPDDDTTDDNDTPDDEEIPAEDFVTVKGQQIPRSELERLYEFDQFLRNDQAAAQRVAQAIQPPTGGQPPVPTPAAPASQERTEFVAPEPPDYLDLEDPAQRFAWDNHVATEKRFFDKEQEDKQRWSEMQSERQQRVNQQAAQDMQQAEKDFKAAFPNLNDDDMKLVRDAAGTYIPTVAASMGYNPAMLYRSMEIAAWANGDLRSKLVDPTKTTPTNHQRSTSRKRKLGQVSGTPRSAPKTEGRVAFTSDKDMVNELAHALAENGFGNRN